MTRRLAELLPAAHSAHAADVTVSGIALDSRRVDAGDLFIALPGARDDGRRHAAAAVGRGAAAVLWQAGEPVPALGVPVIVAEDARSVAGHVASAFFGAPSAAMPVAGVTGTNGKTTVAWLLAGLLTRCGVPAGFLGSVGSSFAGRLSPARLTTDDIVGNQRLLACLREQGARAACMEVSSHALDQGRVAGITFAVAIFTNLTRDHLDYHGTLAAYGAAKRRLFEWPGLRARVINVDDAFGRSLCGVGAGHLTTCSERDGAADVHWRRTGVAADGLTGELATPAGVLQVASPLVGRFNLANLAAAIAGGMALGIDAGALAAAAADVGAPPGRMQAWRRDGVLALVDYAHTPDGLEKALGAVRELAGGRVICVFGCGGDRDRGKRPLMGAIAERLADRVVLTDDNPRGEPPADIVAGILAGTVRRAAIVVEHDRAAAIRFALATARRGDVVLVAGKGHEDYQERGGVRSAFSDAEQVAHWAAAAPAGNA
jgi:UDP-N-acetylmuramoyl-L-alanyl-D-glutamate--2,6-diaminopimelate ligase